MVDGFRSVASERSRASSLSAEMLCLRLALMSSCSTLRFAIISVLHPFTSPDVIIIALRALGSGQNFKFGTGGSASTAQLAVRWRERGGHPQPYP